MKRKLQFLFMVCAALTGYWANAQINYTANFNTGMNNWDSFEFYQDTEYACAGAGSLIGNIYAFSDYGEVYSPNVGTSNGQVATLTYQYKIVEYGTDTPTTNAQDWGTFKVYWAPTATGPFTLIQTIDTSNHIVSANCATKTVTFVPPAGTNVFIGLLAEIGNYDNDYNFIFDQVSITQPAATACTGAPVASNTVASATSLCNGASATMSLSQFYTNTGITYQWQSSPDNITYTNVATGGTAATYTTTQAASRWYRAVITCTASTQSVTSTPVQVVNSGLNCPCNVTFADDIEPITSVNFAGINNTSSAAVNGTPGLQSFTNIAPAQVTAGQTYPIVLKGNTAGSFTNNFTVYFDWNHDGDFNDPGERYEAGTINSSTGLDAIQATSNILVPATALPGITYMRVMKLFLAYADNPCSSTAGSGYGQVEDYLVNVTVTCTTAAPVATASQTVCAGSTIANLTATGTAIQWYAAATGGTPLAATTALVNGTIYYATQTPAGGCESITRTAVTAQITVTPAPVATASQTVCAGSTIANLTATGTAIQWYAAATGGTPLAATTALVNGTVYYATQTPAGGCESTTRTAVTVQITVTPAPVAQALQIVCSGSTVADLVAEGNIIEWYAAATGGEPLIEETTLVDGTVYYAAQTPEGGCESTARTAVTVQFSVIPPPPAENATQVFCEAGTVADLEVDADGTLIWYTAATGGTVVSEDTALVNGTVYYASQTVDGCQSATRTAVTASITVMVAPTGDATQTVAVTADGTATLDDLDVEADGNITWYASEDDAVNNTNALDPETYTIAIGQTVTLYAVQTIGECVSEPFAVTVDVVLGNKDFAMANLSYYPNPVKDVFTVTNTAEISSITVYNLLGQQVIDMAINHTQAQLDLSGLSAGAYMVRVTAGTATATIKIMKQ
jgi:hypothetical protein